MRPDLPLPTDIATELREFRRWSCAATATGARLRKLRGIAPPTFRATKPLANDSPDHLHPWGTKRDNSSSWGFNLKLAYWIGWEHLSVLDLGCSGGAFVRSVLDSGCLACGIEGSDLSRKLGRAAWAYVPEYLFTADVTAPFAFYRSEGTRRKTLTLPDPEVKFSVVTAWELLEHVKESDLEGVFSNVLAHLAPGGVFIASIATEADMHEGINLHQTVRPRDWWLERLQAAGLSVQSRWNQYFGSDFIRGPHNAGSSFNVVCIRDGDRRAPPPSAPLKWSIYERASDSNAAIESEASMAFDEKLLWRPFHLWANNAPREEVIRAAKECIDFGLCSTSIDVLLANSLSVHGDDREARQFATRALGELSRIEATIARLHLVNAVGLLAEGRTDDARREIEKAHADVLEPFWLHFHRTSIHVRLKQYRAALKEGRLALARNPDRADLRDLLAKIREEATRRRLELAQLCLGQGRLRFTCVLARHLPDDAREAILSFVRAVQSSPAAALEVSSPPALHAPPILTWPESDEFIWAVLSLVPPGVAVATSRISVETATLLHRLKLRTAAKPDPNSGPVYALMAHPSMEEIQQLAVSTGAAPVRILILEVESKRKAHAAIVNLAPADGEAYRVIPCHDGARQILIVGRAARLSLLGETTTIRAEVEAESLAIESRRLGQRGDWLQMRLLGRALARHRRDDPLGYKILAQAIIGEAHHLRRQGLRDTIEAVDHAAGLEGESTEIKLLREAIRRFHHDYTAAGDLGETRNWIMERAVHSPDILREHLVCDPDWIEGWKRLGQLCAEDPSRSATAFAAAAALEQLEPAGTAALELRARTMMASRDWSAAARHWRALVERRPSEPLYLDQFGRAQAQYLKQIKSALSAHMKRSEWDLAICLCDATCSVTGGWAECMMIGAVATAYAGGPESTVQKKLLDAERHGCDRGRLKLVHIQIMLQRRNLEGALHAFTSAIPDLHADRYEKPSRRLRARLLELLEARCWEAAGQGDWMSVATLLDKARAFAVGSEIYEYWSGRSQIELMGKPYPQSDTALSPHRSRRVLALEVSRLLESHPTADPAFELSQALESERYDDWPEEVRRRVKARWLDERARRAAAAIEAGRTDEAISEVQRAVAVQIEWPMAKCVNLWCTFLRTGSDAALAAFQAATPGLLEAVPPHLRSVLTSWSRLGRNSACIEDFTVAISTLPPGFIDARRTWTKLLADWLAHRASGNDPLDFSSPGGMALRQTMEAAARDADDAETYWLCRLFTPAGPPDARRPPPSAPISAAAQAGRLLCAVIEGSPLGELWNRFLRSSELQSRRPIRASDGIERLLALSLFAEAPKNIARALRFLANLGWGIEPLIILLVRGPAEIAAGRETLLAQGLRVFPDSEKLLELAVADAAARGDWPVALAHVRKMRNAHPGHARLGELEACVQEHILGPQLENARRTKRFGYYSDARARYEEILEVWPDCAEACFELARITDELRADIPRALELYHRALMAGWNAYDVHFHRGLLYFETNHGFESFKDLLTAASLRADCAVSKAIVRRLGTRECENWTNSAENWLNEGLLEQAAWVLETLAESDFATARIHYLYACTRSNRGQKDTKTLRHFELALQLGAPAFWVHYNRAFTHHALGNGPAAYEDLKEAARLDPSHSGVTWALKEWFPALSTP